MIIFGVLLISCFDYVVIIALIVTGILAEDAMPVVRALHYRLQVKLPCISNGRVNVYTACTLTF